MECLKGKVAWIEGTWVLGEEVRQWNALQNVNRDIALLKHYLVGIVKADLRSRGRVTPAPLLEQAGATP